jgi:hypothetical protein
MLQKRILVVFNIKRILGWASSLPANINEAYVIDLDTINKNKNLLWLHRHGGDSVKKYPIFILIFLSVSSIFWTGCSADNPASSPSPPPSTAITVPGLQDNPDNAVPQDSGSHTKASTTPDPPNNISQNDQKEVPLKADPLTAIPEIIKNTVKAEYEPPFASEEEKEMQKMAQEIAQKMGDLGFPVVRYDENMLNYEPVAEFFKKAMEGKDGEVTVYYYPTWFYINEIQATTFSFQKGKMIATWVLYTAEGSEKQEPLNVVEFNFTKKGNLYYKLEDYTEYHCFRISPLSEQSREYYQKYIVPGWYEGWTRQGPLDVSWSSSDFSQLNWDYTLDMLWLYENGTYMGDSKYLHRASGNEQFDRIIIPQDVVERLLQKYLDVPTQTLRAMEQYNEKEGTYTFHGYNGGGYTPRLEVSKWQNNADGTLTLWIDFVELEFGKELAAQSILTVRPGEDGSFKYIANQYIEME